MSDPYSHGIIMSNCCPDGIVYPNSYPDELITSDRYPDRIVTSNVYPDKKITSNDVPDRKITSNRYTDEKIRRIVIRQNIYVKRLYQNKYSGSLSAWNSYVGLLFRQNNHVKSLS